MTALIKRAMANKTQTSVNEAKYLVTEYQPVAGFFAEMVGWVGIEPTTNGLKVQCSTD